MKKLSSHWPDVKIGFAYLILAGNREGEVGMCLNNYESGFGHKWAKLGFDINDQINDVIKVRTRLLYPLDEDEQAEWPFEEDMSHYENALGKKSSDKIDIDDALNIDRGDNIYDYGLRAIDLHANPSFERSTDSWKTGIPVSEGQQYSIADGYKRIISKDEPKDNLRTIDESDLGLL